MRPTGLRCDITGTYFEGAGPAGFARHGHSRDGKPHNVQVIVAVVMVSGWPIAHHVWAGNEIDHTTVEKTVTDLHRRFGFNRLVFVGDRGMATHDNLQMITTGGHGYLVGLKRRRNRKLSRWLETVDETQWIDCPVGITAWEKADPPRTRAQEVPSGIEGMRVIIIDSDERRGYEEAMRQKSMERTRQALEKLRERVAAGKLKQPEKIGAAAERVLQRNHGYRYYSWDIHQGGFRYFENEESLASEKGIEGKYVIATSESGLSVLDVVAIYEDLSDLERRIPPAQGRVGDAADLSSDRAAGEGPYLRGRAGVAGAAASESSTRGRGHRLLRGARHGGVGDGASGDLPAGYAG